MNYYNDYGKALISINVGGTTVDISRGQMVRMVASVAASTVAGVATGQTELSFSGICEAVINNLTREFVTLLVQETIRDILVRKYGVNPALAGLISSIAAKFVSDNWDLVSRFVPQLGTVLKEWTTEEPTVEEKTEEKAVESEKKEAKSESKSESKEKNGGEKLLPPEERRSHKASMSLLNRISKVVSGKATPEEAKLSKDELEHGIKDLRVVVKNQERRLENLKGEWWHRSSVKNAQVKALTEQIENNKSFLKALESIDEAVQKNPELQKGAPVSSALSGATSGLTKSTGDPVADGIRNVIVKGVVAAATVVYPDTPDKIKAKQHGPVYIDLPKLSKGSSSQGQQENKAAESQYIAGAQSIARQAGLSDKITTREQAESIYNDYVPYTKEDGQGKVIEKGVMPRGQFNKAQSEQESERNAYISDTQARAVLAGVKDQITTVEQANAFNKKYVQVETRGEQGGVATKVIPRTEFDKIQAQQQARQAENLTKAAEIAKIPEVAKHLSGGYNVKSDQEQGYKDLNKAINAAKAEGEAKALEQNRALGESLKIPNVANMTNEQLISAVGTKLGLGSNATPEQINTKLQQMRPESPASQPAPGATLRTTFEGVKAGEKQPTTKPAPYEEPPLPEGPGGVNPSLFPDPIKSEPLKLNMRPNNNDPTHDNLMGRTSETAGSQSQQINIPDQPWTWTDREAAAAYEMGQPFTTNTTDAFTQPVDAITPLATHTHVASSNAPTFLNQDLPISPMPQDYTLLNASTTSGTNYNYDMTMGMVMYDSKQNTYYIMTDTNTYQVSNQAVESVGLNAHNLSGNTHQTNNIVYVGDVYLSPTNTHSQTNNPAIQTGTISEPIKAPALQLNK
jgi:hypothetical protein